MQKTSRSSEMLNSGSCDSVLMTYEWPSFANSSRAQLWIFLKTSRCDLGDRRPDLPDIACTQAREVRNVACRVIKNDLDLSLCAELRVADVSWCARPYLHLDQVFDKVSSYIIVICSYVRFSKLLMS